MLSIESVNHNLWQNSQDWGGKALLIDPYKMGLKYLIQVKSSDNDKLSLKDRCLCLLAGISLCIPIINTIVYIVLKKLYAGNDEKIKTAPPAQIKKEVLNQPHQPPCPYIENINKMCLEVHHMTKKIVDQSIQKDVDYFIKQLRDNAIQLIKNQIDINICKLIVDNMQHEIICMRQQIEDLGKQDPETVNLIQKPEQIPPAALQWVDKINNAIFSCDDVKWESLLVEGGKEFINQRFPVFMNGTLLHHLAKMPHEIQYIPQLIEAGGDCALQDNWGNTPLLWAIANANNTGALLILKTAKEKDYLDKQCNRQNTALHLAVAKGYKDKSKDGKKLEHSNLELIQLILDLKANPNLKNKSGHTPLHLAYIRRDPQMIQALLQAGADPNIEDKEGKTAKEMLQLNYNNACQILKETCQAYLLNENEFNANLDLLLI